jgi:predicted signal transduction protein with EAL and GGDEF domain
MDVVAEGVETKDQLENVEDLSCELVQGFYFSKPVTGEETQALIKERADLQRGFEVLQGTGSGAAGSGRRRQIAAGSESQDGALACTATSEQVRTC